MESISNANTSRISSSVLRQLSQLQAYKSLFVVMLEWIVIATAVFLHIKFPNPFVYLFTYLVIATRLYAFYSLIHEAIHNLIVKNKRLNDIIGQVFLGFPLFINLKKMRAVHFAHHKYLFSDQDPEMKLQAYSEFTFPKSKLELAKIMFMDLSGFNFIKYKVIKLIYNIKTGNEIKSISNSGLSIVLFILVLVIGYYFKILDTLFFYWFLPYATLYQFLNRLRLSTEHFNIDESKQLKTRSVIPNWFQRLTIIPYNLGYHTEHHLYPGIPFYNLPKLQKVLLEDDIFSKNSTIEHGFFSITQEYIK